MPVQPHQKRTVTFHGTTYKVRSNRIELPDLEAMGDFAALTWLIQNTYPRGTSHRRPQSKRIAT
jgi:hypothetical protein